MKNRIIKLFYLVSLFLIAGTALAQVTPIFRITVVNPPANLPECRTRLKTTTVGGRSKTFFSVMIRRDLELDLSGGALGFETEGNHYIFKFEADSGTCSINGSAYEITTSGSVVNAAPAATSAPTPVATPNPIFVPSAAKTAKDTEDAQKIDFSIPESPGFTILGLTPQTVTRPATPRELVTTVINSLDRNGNLQSGIAIDTAPYQLFLGDDVTRPQYKKSYLTRFLWRTQFSLATAKGTTEADKSARVGAGLNMTFFDNGDLDLDEVLATCNRTLNLELEEAAYQALGFSGSDDPRLTAQDVTKAKTMKDTLVNQAFLSKYEKCAKDSEKRNFGKSTFGVGVASSWISKNGNPGSFKTDGQGIWTSLAYGFEGIPGFRCTEDEIANEANRCMTPQLIFHFRRRVRETVPDPLVNGAFTTKDSNLVGGRLRIGVPKWAVNLEGAYQGERYAGKKASSKFEASFGADYRLAPNLYLNFSIGGQTKDSSIPGKGKVFVRTSFNWGTSQTPIQNQ